MFAKLFNTIIFFNFKNFAYSLHFDTIPNLIVACTEQGVESLPCQQAMDNVYIKQY